MNIRKLLPVATMVFLLGVSFLSARAVPSDRDGASGGTHFSVAEPTQIPGKTLQPGAYSIRVADRMSDRMIIRVESSTGGEPTTFLALPVSNLPRPGRPGPISLSIKTDGKSALRGFSFPDGVLAEFVYPKGEAVSLAKANDTKIPAIDPESEGKVTTALSHDDMQLVTLWMLSPTVVGPNDSGPGVTAERFQAKNIAPKAKAKPLLASLPHTAGYMPLLSLVGFGSLLCAVALLRRRVLA
jgi:hypothetical protein